MVLPGPEGSKAYKPSPSQAKAVGATLRDIYCVAVLAMGIRMCLDEPDVSVVGPVHDVLPPREVHEVRLADSSSSPVSDTSCYDLLPLKLGVGERLRDPRKPCIKLVTQPRMCALLSRLSPLTWGRPRDSYRKGMGMLKAPRLAFIFTTPCARVGELVEKSVSGMADASQNTAGDGLAPHRPSRRVLSRGQSVSFDHHV